MAFKHILVPLFGYDADRTALDAALTLAKRGGAHISVRHIKVDPMESVPLMVDVGVAATELIEAVERHAATRGKAAAATFEAWRNERDLKIDDQPSLRTGITTAFKVEEGAEDELIIKYGRLTDLVVMGRPSGEEAGDQVLSRMEDALFGAGQPVLLVPNGLGQPALDRLVSGPALISWNGSIEATRAISQALDLLRGMAHVRVLSVKEGKKDRHPAVDLVRYLAWEGVAASVVEPSQTTGNAGEQILATAKHLGAGFVLMGGYSHGRLRQLMLGGVTSHMMDHADLPVIMAH
ncbi:universal stress protein [Dongia sedimenti]|uniref:Universal stress protein n=1 Tax=Dongia sedimenti TaxID=3064282 RepID=A0ABU0YNX5_9PROT|nr:universal stress protein [Rhodospirillaceae bacterium R-7]